jgi:hypothetical protein
VDDDGNTKDSQHVTIVSGDSFRSLELAVEAAPPLTQHPRRYMHLTSEYLWSSLRKGNLHVLGVLVAQDETGKFSLDNLTVSIKNKRYPLACTPSRGYRVFGQRCVLGIYRFSIPIRDLERLPNRSEVRLHLGQPNGQGPDQQFDFAGVTRVRAARRGRFHLVHSGKSKAFVYQSATNGLLLIVRPPNHTDGLLPKFKILSARIASMVYRPKLIMLYEKHAARYEESASILFEALLDSGCKNVRYVLDPNAIEKVRKRYQANTVKRFSFRHYYLYFAARTLISTELPAHAIERLTSDKLVIHHRVTGRYEFVFLGHGPTYMVSLDSAQRMFFHAGLGLPKRSKIVCSSGLEASHFVEHGGYQEMNMYICGVPKFDRAVQNPDANLILIMPTWQPWASNEIRTEPTESRYYKMLREMYAGVPEDLTAVARILPHPLIYDALTETELADHMWKSDSLDEALRQTALLVTDYSSIAYDAFHRGAGVVFWWKEKDYCMKQYGGRLMIDEETAFGPVCWDRASLAECIRQLYGARQDQEYQERYRRIVAFNDDKNTNRLIKLLRRDNLI